MKTRRESKTGRLRGISSLDDALGSLLKETGLDRRLRDSAVFAAWSAALGPRLAPRARAVRFTRGELLVEVESSAHLQELKSFTGQQYQGEANRALGEQRIRTVVFKLKR